MNQPPVTSVHTGDERCPVRPLHDPCHTGSSEDGRTLDDMTVMSLLMTWRKQVRGTAEAGDGRQAFYETLEEAGTAGSGAYDLTRVRKIIEVVDAHLDSSANPEYQAQPLAQDWARITKVCEEAGEVWRAHSKMTGENPRKGRSGTREDLLDELGDTASAALCAIQHVTKDTGVTWEIFLKALDKARSRVPAASPFPPESGMSRQDAIDNGIIG